MPGFLFDNGMVKLSGSNNAYLENYKKMEISPNLRAELKILYGQDVKLDI
jgi:hypothetical protein